MKANQNSTDSFFKTAPPSFDGVVCPECGEYWEPDSLEWVQCPMCDHEFEANLEESSRATGYSFDDLSVVSESASPESFALLMEIASPQIYRGNAFRVTGLAITASNREVDRHLDKLKKLQNQGRNLSPDGPLPLRPIPDSDRVREAAQRLKDTERRLIDEFFWFWPTDWNQAIDPELNELLKKEEIELAATVLMQQETGLGKWSAVHNLAILFHAVALDLEFESTSRQLTDGELDKRNDCWLLAFKYWRELASDDSFWNYFSRRVAQLDDPRLSAKPIRVSLQLALATIVAKLAERAADTNNSIEVSTYLHLLQNSAISQHTVDEALNRVVQPLRDRVNCLCEGAKNSAASDVSQTDRFVQELLTTSTPLLEKMTCLISESQTTSHQVLLDGAYDEVALLVQKMLGPYVNLTHQHEICIQYLEQAALLVKSDSLKERIRESLEIVRHNLEIARQEAEERRIGDCLDELNHHIDKLIKSTIATETKYLQLNKLAERRLRAIKEEWGAASQVFQIAGDLVAIAFRDVAIDLHNTAQQFHLALEAIQLAAKHCFNPELKKKIEDEVSRIQKNAEFERLTKDLKPISNAPSLQTVNGIGTTLYGYSDYDKNTKSYLTTLYFVFFAIPIFPIARYRAVSLGGNAYRFMGKAPLRKSDVVHRFVAAALLAAFCYSLSTSAPNSANQSVITNTPAEAIASTRPYTISELIDNLDHSDKQIRLGAVRSLTERGAEAEEALPRLRARLKDRSKEVRAAASTAIAQITRSLKDQADEQKPLYGSAEQLPTPRFQEVSPPPRSDFSVQNRELIEQLKGEIETAKTQLRSLESELDSMETQVNSFRTQLETYSMAIKRYERDMQLGLSVNEYEYKNTLARHNSIVDEHNQLLASIRSKTAEHRQLVKDVNAKIDQYNAAIKGQR